MFIIVEGTDKKKRFINTDYIVQIYVKDAGKEVMVRTTEGLLQTTTKLADIEKQLIDCKRLQF